MQPTSLAFYTRYRSEWSISGKSMAPSNPYHPHLAWIDDQYDRMCSLVNQWAAINSGTENLAGLKCLTAEITQAFEVLEGDVRFPDLVAIADVMISKPGYGIVSECALHQTTMVMVKRSSFRETPFLLEGFRRIGPCVELSPDDFFAGHWDHALTMALASQTPWSTIAPDATFSVVQQLAEILSF